MPDFLGLQYSEILELYRIFFHAVVVFGPEHDFLFKSVSSYCALILDFCQPICSLWKWTRSVPVKKWWETTRKKNRKKLIPTKRTEMNPNHFWIIFLRICMSKRISTKYWSPEILLRICLKIKILNPVKIKHWKNYCNKR